MAFFSFLSHRCLVSVAGPDRRTFLQGLISNDLRLCQPATPIYSALLTPQGKFLHDFFVIDHDERFLIDIDHERSDDFLKKLLAYRLRSKVDMQKEPLKVAACWTENGSKPTLPSPSDLITAYIDPRLSSLGYRLVVSTAAPPPEVTIVDEAAYNLHRLSLSVPDGTQDLEIGQSTLLEYNLDQLNAISWTKGCYIGQELTARMHYRHLGKKKIYPVEILGDSPQKGDPVTYRGDEVGIMRSHEASQGLALLYTDRVEKLSPGERLLCGTSSLVLKTK